MKRASLTSNLKEALVQALTENRDAVRDLLAEVLEDVALASAIRQGEKTRPVKRATVLRALSRRR